MTTPQAVCAATNLLLPPGGQQTKLILGWWQLGNAGINKKGRPSDNQFFPELSRNQLITVFMLAPLSTESELFDPLTSM